MKFRNLVVFSFQITKKAIIKIYDLISSITTSYFKFFIGNIFFHIPFNLVTVRL